MEVKIVMLIVQDFVQVPINVEIYKKLICRSLYSP